MMVNGYDVWMTGVVGGDLAKGRCLSAGADPRGGGALEGQDPLPLFLGPPKPNEEGRNVVCVHANAPHICS